MKILIVLDRKKEPWEEHGLMRRVWISGLKVIPGALGDACIVS
jgi:hypothetical protein